MTDETSDYADESLAWPEKGDVLFTSGNDWWNNACPIDDWGLYTAGYKKAADILVEHVKERHCDQDLVVFPVVFLYRQYLELNLKQLIAKGNRLQDENPEVRKSHKLDLLWSLCRPILVNLEPNGSQQELEAIDEIIAQFCTVDSTSEAFRYPITRKGAKAIPSDVEHINLQQLSDDGAEQAANGSDVINLRQLSDVMKKVANFLDSSDMMISGFSTRISVIKSLMRTGKNCSVTNL